MPRSRITPEQPTDGSCSTRNTFVSAASLEQPQAASPFRGLTRLVPEHYLALMDYIRARNWQEARQVLEKCPLHCDGWAVEVLRELLDAGCLSAYDQEMLLQHIYALELASEQGPDALTSAGSRAM